MIKSFVAYRCPFKKRAKRESGANPERCRHCVWELSSISLGNWEEEDGDEQSQETCLYVESQICGPQIDILTEFVFILSFETRIVQIFVGVCGRSHAAAFYSIPGDYKKEG